MRAGAGGFFGGGAAAPVTPIHFASLFPTAFQVLQTDFGLSYGAKMRPDPGNGSTADLGLSGAIAGVPVPIMVRITNSSGQGNVYFDGLGVTPAMNGVTFAAGVPLPLTGAGTGKVITPTAGSLFPNNTWKATCAALADQTANGFNALAGAGVAAEPIVDLGVNGKPALLFDPSIVMSNPTIGSALAFPYQVLVVAQALASNPVNNAIVCSSSAAGTIYQVGTDFVQYNNLANANAIPFNMNLNRFAAHFTGSTSDSLQVGATLAQGQSAGPGTSANRGMGASFGSGRGLTGKIYAVIYTPIVSFAAFDAALNSPGGYGPGAVFV